jgi:hypothetical protein
MGCDAMLVYFAGVYRLLGCLVFATSDIACGVWKGHSRYSDDGCAAARDLWA